MSPGRQFGQPNLYRTYWGDDESDSESASDAGSDLWGGDEEDEDGPGLRLEDSTGKTAGDRLDIDDTMSACQPFGICWLFELVKEA